MHAAKIQGSELPPMKQYAGVVTGIVKSLQDPDGQGRIELQFPWLSESVRSSWAPVAAPMAGKERGAFFMPEEGDEVLVAFEHGNFDHPFIIGFLWNGVDAPWNDPCFYNPPAGYEYQWGED